MSPTSLRLALLITACGGTGNGPGDGGGNPGGSSLTTLGAAVRGWDRPGNADLIVPSSDEFDVFLATGTLFGGAQPRLAVDLTPLAALDAVWEPLAFTCAGVSASDPAARSVAFVFLLADQGTTPVGVLSQGEAEGFELLAANPTGRLIAYLAVDRPVRISGRCQEADVDGEYDLNLQSGWNAIELEFTSDGQTTYGEVRRIGNPNATPWTYVDMDDFILAQQSGGMLDTAARLIPGLQPR